MRRHRGIALLETLVAMVVVAFVLLAVARLQLALALGGEVARSRSEATVLAREALESLRAGPTEALASGADTPGADGHGGFQRQWTVSGHDGDAVRAVDVAVAWTDRRGEGHALSLASVVARVSAVDAGAAVLQGASADPWWRPAGRHHAVPADAVSPRDGTGRVTLPWSGPSGGVLVFDAVSGGVVQHCGASGDAPEQCRPLTAYLLEGHVHARRTGGLRLVFDRLQPVDGTPECVWNDVMDRRTGRRLDGVRHYRCLVAAADHDGDAATPPAWSGRTRLAGVEPPGAPVCRYSPAADASANADHPETYTAVDVSLDHQNFVVPESGDCPAGAVPHPPA